MSRMKEAFTLVEILIVVIILGILAAVVIPQFSEASGDTRASSVMADLKMIRGQIQLYKAQHLEDYPDDFVNQMIMYSDVAGNTNVSYTTTFRFGPYVLRMPPSPYTGVNAVSTAIWAPGDATTGWWYDAATGEFRCHTANTVETPSGDTVNEL